jgi:hypothetical protein
MKKPALLLADLGVVITAFYLNLWVTAATWLFVGLFEELSAPRKELTFWSYLSLGFSVFFLVLGIYEVHAGKPTMDVLNTFFLVLTNYLIYDYDVKTVASMTPTRMSLEVFVEDDSKCK